MNFFLTKNSLMQHLRDNQMLTLQISNIEKNKIVVIYFPKENHVESDKFNKTK